MIGQAFQSFFNLIYPRLCLSCEDNLAPKEAFLCIDCQLHLPKTNFHLSKENPFTEYFWGRVNVQTAAAMYYFSSKSGVQRLIHQLKYANKPMIAYSLGRLYGLELKQQPHYSSITAVVPVPLHPKKQHQRGYNQAAYFAKGLAESLAIHYWPNALERLVYTSTQTKKTRIERMNNVLEAFSVRDAQKLKGQHILIADDVLTTGATLEACAAKVLAVANTQVSLATIAIASE